MTALLHSGWLQSVEILGREYEVRPPQYGDRGGWGRGCWQLVGDHGHSLLLMKDAINSNGE